MLSVRRSVPALPARPDKSSQVLGKAADEEGAWR
jgi:hypothetical protein